MWDLVVALNLLHMPRFWIAARCCYLLARGPSIWPVQLRVGIAWATVVVAFTDGTWWNQVDTRSQRLPSLQDQPAMRLAICNSLIYWEARNPIVMIILKLCCLILRSKRSIYYIFSTVVSQPWGFRFFVSGRPESPTEMPVPTDVPSPTTPCDDEGAGKMPTEPSD